MHENPTLIGSLQRNLPIDDDNYGFTEQTSNNEPNVMDEIAKIMSYISTMPLLQFWATRGNDFPILKLLARQYLAIPATSAASERVFSQVNLLDNRLRSRLDMEKINNMVMAKN